MMKRRLAILTATATFVFVAVVVASPRLASPPQDRTRTAWDGIYTKAQAERGKAAYVKACTECHGDDLKGVEDVRAPALNGERFQLLCDHTTVGDLLDKVSNTMPKQDPGSLSRREYVDIVAFLLQSNMDPEGSEE